MRKTIALLIIFSVIGFYGNLYAKEKRGVNVEIYMTKPKIKMERTPWEEKNSPDIRGELIAVKENSLLLKNSQSGVDESVNVSEIVVLFINKKSKAGIGFFAGGALGALAGLLTYSSPKSEGFTIDFGPGLNAAVGGALGAIIGVAVGAVAGADAKIQIEGKSEAEIKKITEELRKKARIPNFQ